MYEIETWKAGWGSWVGRQRDRQHVDIRAFQEEVPRLRP